MALDTAFYFVTQDIAIRSGLAQSRYRISDGRFVLDNKDLSRVRFTTDEYISGLKGVEKTDYATAQTKIAQNGYQMGLGTKNYTYNSVNQPTNVENDVDENGVEINAENIGDATTFEEGGNNENNETIEEE